MVDGQRDGPIFSAMPSSVAIALPPTPPNLAVAVLLIIASYFIPNVSAFSSSSSAVLPFQKTLALHRLCSARRNLLSSPGADTLSASLRDPFGDHKTVTRRGALVTAVAAIALTPDAEHLAAEGARLAATSVQRTQPIPTELRSRFQATRDLWNAFWDRRRYRPRGQLKIRQDPTKHMEFPVITQRDSV